MTEAQVTREKLMADVDVVIKDSEALVKAMAAAGGEKAAALRADLESKLGTARQHLAELERTAVERARAAARDADHYVHEHPWRAVALGAAIAGVVGIVLGLLLNRR
jgi:ElaB/YqjD/DUF883 family membrane-anchored ribosome-binding protein